MSTIDLPASFMQMMIMSVFAELNSSILHYLDDVLFCAPSMEMTLSRFGANNLKLSHKQCYFLHRSEHFPHPRGGWCWCLLTRRTLELFQHLETRTQWMLMLGLKSNRRLNISLPWWCITNILSLAVLRLQSLFMLWLQDRKEVLRAAMTGLFSAPQPVKGLLGFKNWSLQLYCVGTPRL